MPLLVVMIKKKSPRGMLFLRNRSITNYLWKSHSLFGYAILSNCIIIKYLQIANTTIHGDTCLVCTRGEGGFRAMRCGWIVHMAGTRAVFLPCGMAG